MLRLLATVLAAGVVAAPARAQQPQQQVTEIFKCRGADGHWTYTNDRRDAERMKCEVVTRQVNVAPAPPMPVQSAPAPVGRTTRPADFAGLELLATAVVALDDDFVVRYANPAAESLLATAAKSLIGQPFLQLFAERAELERSLAEALRTHWDYSAQNVTYHRP